MTDEELAECEKILRHACVLIDSEWGDSSEEDQALDMLLAEVGRLRAQVAAMRPVVEAMATASQPFDAQPGSGVEILYARIGTQEQARALLAKEVIY